MTTLTETHCLLSRQPIHNSAMDVAAYELRTNQMADNGEMEVFRMFTESALDLVVGERPGLITLTPDSLWEEKWKAIPKTRIVLGYFEDFSPTFASAKKLAELTAKGYPIALSDTLCRESMEMLSNPGNMVRLDVTKYLPDELEKRVAELKQFETKIFGENVNTYDDLEFCKCLEFDYYQGHFLSKPAAVKKEIPVNRLTMMRLLSKLQDPQILIPELEQLVSQDIALSYKLLRHANSAAVALPRAVNSVGHAVRLIGMDMLKTWSSALLLSTVEDKPRELMNVALVRARMCELLALATKNSQKESFLSAGLLSVLDALLDRPMEQAVAELPLTDDIKNALIKRSGAIGQALNCTIAYERAEWDDVRFENLSPTSIREKYMEAIAWARQLTSGLLTA